MDPTPGTILYKYSSRQGWDTDSVIELLLQYIKNQQSNDAFEDFLARAAEEENAILE